MMDMLATSLLGRRERPECRRRRHCSDAGPHSDLGREKRLFIGSAGSADRLP